MSLTVRELTEIPSLRTRIVAGGSGSDNLVIWAHTCELPDPWNWLGTGDLLLTDGYNFPATAPEQVEFLTSLSRGNLVGIVLGDGLYAPPLTDEAVAAADALAFPILMAAYEVPFVTVSRTVADSNSKDTHGRLVRILRVYDVLRRFNQAGPHNDSLLDALSRESGAELHVLDTRSGASLLPTTRPLDARFRDALLTTLAARTSPIPGSLRVPVDDVNALGLPLDDGSHAVLLAIPAGGNLDVMILQHVATIAALDVERRSITRARRHESEVRFFQQLLDGSIDTDAGTARLTSLSLGNRPWRIICRADDDSPTSDQDLELFLVQSRVPHLHTVRGKEQLILVSDGTVRHEVAEFAADSRVRLGLSQPVHIIPRFSDAAREARWALEAARSKHRSLAEYGEDTPLFLPRTLAEGEAVVAAILGPVIDYDETNGTNLVASLETYFAAGRSWQQGAVELGVHKQTLLYRMRRIEQLTKRRLSDVEQQTELYLAVRTWRLLSGR
jgi:PucR family transcriptional regulator, purine catabolism regulatory protein